MNATATNEYGSVVRYDCDEGYQVDDGVPLTFCQGNQTWKDADVATTCTGKLSVEMYNPFLINIGPVIIVAVACQMIGPM